MTSRIILVTHAPTKGGKPLDGASGRRLAALAGMDHMVFVNHFDFTTLLDAPWPSLPRGMDPDARDVATRQRIATEQAQAAALRPSLAGRKVVLLGREVAAAFRLAKGTHYEWFQVVELEPGIEASVFPGGVATWWNDAEIAERARLFAQRLVIWTSDDKTAQAIAALRIAGSVDAAALILSAETGRMVAASAIVVMLGGRPELEGLLSGAEGKINWRDRWLRYGA